VRTSWDIFAIISDSTFTFMMGTGGRKTRSKLFARLVNRITRIGSFLEILRGGVKEMLRGEVELEEELEIRFKIIHLSSAKIRNVGKVSLFMQIFNVLNEKSLCMVFKVVQQNR